MARKVLLTVLAATTLAACGGGEPSLFEKGDFVVYRYSGAYRKDPITLRETVTAKEGNKLEILVEWASGTEKRSWKQFVTDTRYNRDNNIVDRLVLIENGAERELDNRDNLDLFRLFEGTFIMPQRLPKLISTEKKQVALAGRAFDCEVSTYRTKALDKHAVMIETSCPAFKWGKAGAEYRLWYRDKPAAGALYLAEVADFGAAGDKGQKR